MPGRNWWNERVRLGERLLDQVLGVGRVAGHPHRGASRAGRGTAARRARSARCARRRSRWRRRSRRVDVTSQGRSSGSSQSSPPRLLRRGSVEHGEHVSIEHARRVNTPRSVSDSRPTSRTIHSSVASTTIVQRLVLAERAARFGTLKPWSARGYDGQVERPVGELLGRAHRVPLALHHQRRHAGADAARRAGTSRAARAGAAGRPAPGSRRRRASARVRAADRAPADAAADHERRPDAQLRRRPRAGRRRGSAGGVATLRPATRHGCSNRSTRDPLPRAGASASAARSRVSMPLAGAVAEQQGRDGPARAVGDQPAVAVRRGDARSVASSALTSAARHVLQRQRLDQLRTVVAHVADRRRRPGRPRAGPARRAPAGRAGRPGP